MSASSSLVDMSPICTEAISQGRCPVADHIDRRQRNARRVSRRTFFKCISGMKAYKKKTLRWITLTSADGEGEHFQKNFRKLIMRLRRRKMVDEYIRIPEQTKRGERHEHIMFLGTYIEQSYLSALWKKIHNSHVVWINKVVPKTAGYLAKYASKCPEWRVSNSRCWGCRRLCGKWADFKRSSRELHIDTKTMYAIWDNSLFFGIEPLDYYWALCDFRTRNRSMDNVNRKIGLDI